MCEWCGDGDERSLGGSRGVGGGGSGGGGGGGGSGGDLLDNITYGTNTGRLLKPFIDAITLVTML